MAMLLWMTDWVLSIKAGCICPGRVTRLVGASSCIQKETEKSGHGFSPRCRHVWKATDGWMDVCRFVSLPFSTFLSAFGEYVLGWGLKKIKKQVGFKKIWGGNYYMWALLCVWGGESWKGQRKIPGWFWYGTGRIVNIFKVTWLKTISISKVT